MGFILPPSQVHCYKNGHQQQFVVAIRSGFRAVVDIPLLIILNYQHTRIAADTQPSAVVQVCKSLPIFMDQ
jgi:hypothetical protein